ncbi:hypothetical protein XCR1_4270001 [Xenorhabdus cabanillasii JM26]|uniref:Uncharacterized protein n=1 Tax=Xenorhabdus cabanillasii JM26 TaxID=1427517 RepID=W1J9R7_9GAMM|nr:hypothetical protein XCR1_4270001 [Xenorhabdus cabanillasii JM26]
MILLISGTVTELGKINQLDKWENYTIFNLLIELNSRSMQELDMGKSRMYKVKGIGISTIPLLNRLFSLVSWLFQSNPIPLTIGLIGTYGSPL